ncbi:DUF6049 family protein [Parafrigoribacterium humi]|uniref:DUF6049 family protein n=1 Tax=Parafrigoribacterium humi TaxID=3144664 RepID=UPI0032F08F56
MPMRLVTFLLALAMGFGALGLGDSAAQAKTGTPAPGVTFTVSPSALGVLNPNEDLLISGTVSNGTTSAIAAGTVSVYLDRGVVSTRASLHNWLADAPDDDGPHATTEVLQTTIPAIPAGDTRSVYLTVPAAALGLDPSPTAWGVHAIRVRIASGSSEVAVANSSIVWNPGATFQPTRLSLVAPIGTPPSTSGLISADDLATYTSPNGLLTKELDQAIDRRIALAIDPMVIASIRILGTAAPESARSWLTQLQNAGNNTFALSYADADLTAMTQSSTAGVLTPTDFTIDPRLFSPPASTPSPSSTPTTPSGPGSLATTPAEPTLPTSQTLLDWKYTTPGVAWPLDNTVVDKDLATFQQNKLTTTILSSTNVSYGDIDFTPSAAATVDGHRALVADATLSQLFRKAVLAPTTLAWQQAMTELSASLAVITWEQSDAASTLLATLGRSYPTGSYHLVDTLLSLESLPWVSGASLADAVNASPIGATLVDKPITADRIAQVNTLVAAEGAVDTFSSVLQQPTLLTGPERLDLLATLSSGWANDPAKAKSAYDNYLADATKTTNSVTIVESSSIIQPSDKISLPVTVRNDLAYPVEVVVTVHSPSGILHIVHNQVPLVVEANSQAGARIAVQSVANGDVELRVSLASVTGTPISTPSFVDVDVQAQWETLITLGIGALLIAVFGFGIWRNVAKRRKARAEGATDDNPEDIADTDADEQVAVPGDGETGRD